MPGYTPDELVEMLYPHLGGLRFTPKLFTSTDWDGDAKAFDSSGVIDLSAVFGLPAGISAVAAQMSIRDESVGVAATLSSAAGSNDGFDQWTQVANVYIQQAGIVTCDANGDIYFTQSAEFDAVNIRITGYWS